MKNKYIIQENFENSCKTMKKSHACSFPDVDKCVTKLFKQYYGKEVHIIISMLQEKKKKKMITLLKNSDLMVSKQVIVGLKALKWEMALSSETLWRKQICANKGNWW